MSVSIPQMQQSRYMLTSRNNAAQTSTRKKRPSLFRNLFRRRSSKKKIIVGKQVRQNLQAKLRKRTISGGDHVKLSSANRQRISENSIPFASQLSFQQDQSLSSLSDPTSIRQYFHEQNQRINDLPKAISKSIFSEQVSSHTDPYRYKTATASKRVSAIEKLAKQYSSSTSQSDGTGLLWFNANHQLVNT